MSSEEENDVDVNITKRLNSIIYILIVNKYATLKELQEYYSIDDVLDMYEAYRVYTYNKSIMIENIKETRR